MITLKEVTNEAPVAQLDRVTDFESVGYRFDPCRAHIFIISSILFQYFFLMVEYLIY